MFDLTRNPFSILGVSPRVSQGDLSNAKADRLFDHAFPESELEEAYAELLVERKRLVHELSWLSDIAPNRARKIIDTLPNIKIEEAIELLDECGALSALNLAAHLAGRFPDKRGFALKLITLYAAFDWTQVRHAIDEARILSGVKKTTDGGWKKAKAALVDRHASTLLPSITRFDDGPEWLASILSDGEHTITNELLERIIGQYDQWSIPRLTELSEEIDKSLKTLKQTNDPDAEVENLENLLSSWDRISQPVQLRDQAKGLDEKRSLELYYRARDVAIWFANERDNPGIAERISRAFAAAFVELPTVRAKTTADLQTLSENIEVAAESKLLAPLQDAVDEAQANLGTLANQIERGRFRLGENVLAGALFAAFEQARLHANSLTDPSLPWLLMRSVALALNNEQNSPSSAKILLEGVIGSAPETARALLEDDVNQLAASALQIELLAAMKNGNLKGARGLVAQLIEVRPSEYEELSTIQDNLDSQLRTRTLKRIGWGVAAGLFGLYVIIEDGSNSYAEKAATDYSYETPTDYGDDLAEAPVVDDSDELALFEDEVDVSEVPPNPYASGPLTLSQLRYCRFENARLEQLRNRIGARFTVQYNAKIDDYNNRCGAFQYRISDLTQVDAEVMANGDRIRKEASLQMEQWAESGLGSDDSIDWSKIGPRGEDIPVVKPKSAVDQFRAGRQREIEKIIRGIDPKSNGTSGAPSLGARKTDDANIFPREPGLDIDE